MELVGGLVGQGGELVGAPIDRRRADAGEGGDVGPEGAGAGASLHREEAGGEPPPSEVDRVSTVPRACAADLPRRAGPTDPIPRSTCRPSPPLPPTERGRGARRAARSLRPPRRAARAYCGAHGGRLRLEAIEGT